MVLVTGRLVRRLEEKLLAEGTFIPSEDKGVEGGVAPLDDGGMLPPENLPPVEPPDTGGRAAAISIVFGG